MSRSIKRRYRKHNDRQVWVFSELNHDLRPKQIAKFLTAAGLEQARLEAEAAEAHARSTSPSTTPKEVPDD